MSLTATPYCVIFLRKSLKGIRVQELDEPPQWRRSYGPSEGKGDGLENQRRGGKDSQRDRSRSPDGLFP